VLAQPPFALLRVFDRAIGGNRDESSEFAIESLGACEVVLDDLDRAKFTPRDRTSLLEGTEIVDFADGRTISTFPTAALDPAPPGTARTVLPR
jgi:hypothetical protein